MKRSVPLLALCLWFLTVQVGEAEANRTRARQSRGARQTTTFQKIRQNIARRLSIPSISRSLTSRQPTTELKSSRLIEPAKLSMDRSAKRQVSSLSVALKASIEKNSTPGFKLVPANKAKLTQTRYGNYKKSISPAFNITKLGKSGQFDAMMLLPTSGHNGQAKAADWAKTSTYHVQVIHPDGTKQVLGQVKSQDFVTSHGVQLKLKTGETKVQFWALRSVGVAGFKAGREIVLKWDGQ